MAQWFKKLDSQAYKQIPSTCINGRGVGHPVILTSGDRGRTSPEKLAAKASHIGDPWVWLRYPLSMKSGRAIKNYPWHQSWAPYFYAPMCTGTYTGLPIHVKNVCIYKHTHMEKKKRKKQFLSTSNRLAMFTSGSPFLSCKNYKVAGGQVLSWLLSLSIYH